MGRPRRTERPKLLTEVELELMTALWRLGEGTVREVLDELATKKKLAYTSVSTILRVLQGKRLVKARKEGKAHVYRAAVSKSEYERRSLKHLMEKVFDGTPSALVMRLLDDEGLSRDELRRIQDLLEEKLK